MADTKAGIGIGWEVGLPSGWGMYGLNLALDLSRRGIEPALIFTAPLLAANPPPALAGAAGKAAVWQAKLREGPLALDIPLLLALGDRLDLPEQLLGLTGAPTLGVAFCKSAVIPKANLRKLEHITGYITGSTWNTTLLESHGLSRVRYCPQGVDLALFKPGARTASHSGRFTVFSGGKLEYRKGQDLVVAAFAKFRARHDDALLVTAWHNPWPGAAAEMATSPHVKGVPQVVNGRLDVGGWLAANGIEARDHIDLGPIAHAALPDILRGLDVALLPSRCEGGTNLVAMECMACATPVILSRNTGHLDLIGPGGGRPPNDTSSGGRPPNDTSSGGRPPNDTDNCYTLDFQIPIGEITGRADLKGWGESAIDEIVAKLEAVYSDRAQARRRGENGAAFMQNWGWPAQIDRLLAAITEFS